MNDSSEDRLRPDDDPRFRMSQLLLVLTEVAGGALDLERISITEFLAANPFLCIDESDPARTQLRLAGFGEHSLTYAAPGQRFATRRERVLSDLTRLVSLGLVRVKSARGRRVIELTEAGGHAAEQLTSVYADGYRASVRAVAPIVARLSDQALQQKLGTWLRADPLLFDIVDVEWDSRSGQPLQLTVDDLATVDVNHD